VAGENAEWLVAWWAHGLHLWCNLLFIMVWILTAPGPGNEQHEHSSEDRQSYEFRTKWGWRYDKTRNPDDV